MCGLEWLNALTLVGYEILAEAMPELLALEMFIGNKVVRFSFPTAENPHGTRIVYDGEDVAELLKEFLWKKRGKSVSAASSSSAGESADMGVVSAGDKGTSAATTTASAKVEEGPGTGRGSLRKNVLDSLQYPNGSGRAR